MKNTLTPSQRLYEATRKDLIACFETGNLNRAKLVLDEYKEAVKAPELIDMSEDLRSELVAAYGRSF